MYGDDTLGHNEFTTHDNITFIDVSGRIFNRTTDCVEKKDFNDDRHMVVVLKHSEQVEFEYPGQHEVIFTRLQVE